MKRKRNHSNLGFTMLEIMLVVGIIALLLGAAIFKLSGNMEVAKVVRTRADIQAIATQLRTYEALAGTLPSTAQGLDALVHPPQGDPKPQQWRQLADALPIDAWGHPYQYVQPGVHHPDSFDLSSSGPDGQPNTSDDIGNWQPQ